ncbi:hypothetical protein LEP1GSC193_4107 [Leptospira alstonii serovar Pingchang str. 80-412]|uniref:Uncharacterized protein n=1 Tax=Leptospira alstonii serovar Pingchang str. 80-412 TaxID=1218564 RepID=T0GYN7_9LEPT|nr:hypothetical protein LEP1GSC193_4107 [Leptospira alstonii serovar Pingchang str. 80-412]
MVDTGAHQKRIKRHGSKKQYYEELKKNTAELLYKNLKNPHFLKIYIRVVEKLILHLLLFH